MQLNYMNSSEQDFIENKKKKDIVILNLNSRHLVQLSHCHG